MRCMNRIREKHIREAPFKTSPHLASGISKVLTLDLINLHSKNCVMLQPWCIEGMNAVVAWAALG